MVLQLLLISSLALHTFAQDLSVLQTTTTPVTTTTYIPNCNGHIKKREANDFPATEISDVEGSGEDEIGGENEEGSGEDENENIWKVLGLERKKRQATEQQQPSEAAPPQALAQRGRDNSHSHDSDERRHRPNRPSCNTVRCTSGTECIIENGRPTCRPIRPQPSRSCRDVNCPRESVCRMERDPRCRDRRDCREQPVCVRENNRPSCNNVLCPPGLRCRIMEDPGCRGRDCREFATCANPCDGVRCPFGHTCRFDGREPICAPIVLDQCMNARCPPGFQCRTVDGQARCFPVTGPSCRQNEVFTQCASPCEPACDHASPLICPARCDPPRCQCARGFWRHASGACVQQNQCFR